MPDPETWRWLIGGGLGALTIGVGWLVRAAWQAGQTLARIEARLGSHGETLSDHADRILAVEASVNKHSGQLKVAT